MGKVDNEYAIMALQVRVMTLTKMIIEKGIATEEEIQERYEIESKRFLEHIER